jgi:HD-GYP domain-containing protein (c-di-GMP phosphodiesterase class II)
VKLELTHPQSGESVATEPGLGLRPELGLVRSALRALEVSFAQPFSLVDAATGELLYAAASGLTCDVSNRLELLAETANRGRPEIIEHESPLSLLAVPLGCLNRGASLVAIGLLADMQVHTPTEVASAARVFGVEAGRAFEWASRCETWSPRIMLRLAESTIESIAHRAQLSHLQHEINEAVGHARDTYVELGLLHRLARNLDVTQDPSRLWIRALDWLAEAVPAQCLAVVAPPDKSLRLQLPDGEPTGHLLHGESPLNAEELQDLIERLGESARRPLVLNRQHSSSPTWRHPTVRELACVPMLEDGQPTGWLLAINHIGQGGEGMCEFGSAEVRLLDSVGAILGVHLSNRNLVHRQADLFAASVRALTSAIDAKDPYTHGHSERVARVSVCLAEELDLNKEQLDTIYLGGLLHDIGKIGVDDQVLNKPGQLTPEEFEQVKLHPQLGHDILCNLEPLEKILPIVLHHHEAWNGQGYPKGLKGEETPLLARVTAVADAFDAMSSDRPYRRGMDDERIDAILREGAGRQWDPAVIDAFFACRERIRAAVHDAAIGSVPLDPLQWVH